MVYPLDSRSQAFSDTKYTSMPGVIKNMMWLAIDDAVYQEQHTRCHCRAFFLSIVPCLFVKSIILFVSFVTKIHSTINA